MIFLGTRKDLQDHDLNAPQFQEYLIHERSELLRNEEAKIFLAIKPRPSWLTDKAWRWLLKELLVMKHFT